MAHYVLAVDPGKATGFGIITLDDAGAPAKVESFELGFAAFQDAFNTTVFNCHTNGDTVEVVIEDFKFNANSGKKTDAPWSLKHIGVVEFICRMYNVPMTLQTPAAAKSFVDNPRLRQLGFWHKGGAGHANDALRHAVLYLVDKKNWRPEGLLS